MLNGRIAPSVWLGAEASPRRGWHLVCWNTRIARLCRDVMKGLYLRLICLLLTAQGGRLLALRRLGDRGSARLSSSAQDQPANLVLTLTPVVSLTSFGLFSGSFLSLSTKPRLTSPSSLLVAVPFLSFRCFFPASLSSHPALSERPRLGSDSVHTELCFSDLYFLELYLSKIT